MTKRTERVEDTHGNRIAPGEQKDLPVKAAAAALAGY
jgi:hypothetical protein